MPKKQTTASKRARTETRKGQKFTTAYRRHEKPGLSPAELLALGVANERKRAAKHAGDDWSWEARTAQNRMWELEAWEKRRAGRNVRIWSAVIEVKTSALDADDAWHRLVLYTRHPYHRISGGLLHSTWEIEGAGDDEHGHPRTYAPIDPAALTDEERARLDADYPRILQHLDTRGEKYGPWEQAQVQHYVQSLRRAAIRHPESSPGSLPRGLELTYWRAHYRVEFLAGMDEASALPRAEELAATIVDHTGRPVGTVVAGSIRADDGFHNHVDGMWNHPAADTMGSLTRQHLWQDYEDVLAGAEAGRPVGSPQALAAICARAADELAAHYGEHLSGMAEHEAKLHTQPDGSRTYTTPSRMQQVIAQARETAAGKSPAELREMAEHAEYMARRVYGKVVESDADVRRIETTEQQAKTWAFLADEVESFVSTFGTHAAGWPLLGVTWEYETDAEGHYLGLWAETRDGERDLVGLWPHEDGYPVGAYEIVLQTRSTARPLTVLHGPEGTAPSDPVQSAVDERARRLGRGA
ncbi:hypothetical protein SNE510_76690 [Streptomyces sp. NE5-10]|uniref:hypothetical protein n=1 Tax=Streptomyces sp. NE5-10 TaxID=2759674 RepID=UPI001905C383|nr:hypothetical protein [Streptomyces sp. NE5-10]GHJ98150.1 hypothetical protein SNE510_76690 [Streptomyces sp. NE5-10]